MSGSWEPLRVSPDGRDRVTDLHSIAVVCLIGAAICALVVAIHLAAGNRQHMWIMNLVWPVTTLYSGPIGLWAYFHWGILSSRRAMMEAKRQNREPPGKRKPLWQMVATGATHCGAGCTVGDLIAESALIIFPLTLLGKPIFASWAIDYLFALLFGIGFQYFTIKPMRNLSVAEGLKQAFKADVLSLTAWQVGMYGWMAIATFGIFGHELQKTGPVFWFEMQIAMLWGFVTSFPVNWWLLRSGIKEKM
jgi:hypothetical protein